MAEAFEQELRRLCQWWLEHSPDHDLGGFVGEIDYFGKTVPRASKGIVLNSRILWFFSEAAGIRGDPRLRLAADRAFDYLLVHFDDPEHGGVFWELDCRGEVVDDKKQIYALCFCIYAFASYFSLTSKSVALEKALQYFDAIEAHARDRQFDGYVEALSRDWQDIDDVRLSYKDLNAPKTMNTHLHIVEAFAALHRVSPSEKIANALRHSLEVFCKHIVDPYSGHLQLFFDKEWRSLSAIVSYGHDIEASWLLWDAALELGDADLIDRLHPVVSKLAAITLKNGVGESGHVYSELDPSCGRLSDESIWWVQAEALVGFLNAYELTGDVRFISAHENVWRHIVQKHIDPAGGDWHWLADGREVKVGFWKGPYHNGRAMMECLRRIR